MEPCIIDIRADIAGLYVSLRCGSCAAVFERRQPTVGGVPLAQHECPECGSDHELGGDQLAAAAEQLFPASESHRAARINEEARRITECWHQAEAIQRLLSYGGVNLARAAEPELIPLVRAGLLQACRGQRSGS